MTYSAATRTNAVAIVAGLAVLAVGMVIVRDGTVPDVETDVFNAINDLPEALYPLAWPFQQLGALAVGPLVAVVALALRRRRLAIAALAVTVLKLGGERVVKAIVSRERPGTTIGPDIEVRGDVPLDGESFVSGHAVLVAGLAGVVTPYLPGRWKIVPWLLVVGVLFGRVYVGAHNPLDVICGAALGIAIAGFVNLIVGPPRAAVDPAVTDDPVVSTSTRHGQGPLRRAGVGTLAASMVLVLAAGCDTNGDDSTSDLRSRPDAITVGSFDFLESRVLGEVYSQALEAAGFPVHREFGLGAREFVGPAQSAGLLDLVPEYAGTAAEFHSLGAAQPTADETAVHAELQRVLAGSGLVALTAAAAEDANTFVVTAEYAAEHGLRTLSDLKPIAAELTLGGPPECERRPACLLGLRDRYGLHPDFIPLDAGGPLTVQALENGYIDVALMFTSDPTIDERGFVELIDDRHLQPAENVTPLVTTAAIERWGPKFVPTVDAVSARLTTDVIIELNAAAGRPDADVATVVAEWWSEVKG